MDLLGLSSFSYVGVVVNDFFFVFELGLVEA
jgi:hypothetical protein